MQDIHSIGGGGRLFNAGGGDRRLRPQNHQNLQALKCPRCDSLNTKFCYYNNYNLSQPRHFCKSCRRYWTKGGVLRNVPVGGGCRKTKRSNKPKQTATSTTDITTSTAAAVTRPPPEQPPQEQQEERKSSNSRSSSESSSLTATNTAAAGNTGALEVASAHSSSSASNNLLNGNSDSKPFGHSNINSSFHGGMIEQGSDCGIFSEIGSFTRLITSTNDHLGFGFSSIMNQQSVDQSQLWKQQEQTLAELNEGMKLPESMVGGFIDQTVQVELSELQSSRAGNGGFGTLDLQGTGDQGLFDLPNAVDQTYWSQSQWTTTDQDQPNLYIP